VKSDGIALRRWIFIAVFACLPLCGVHYLAQILISSGYALFLFSKIIQNVKTKIK